MILAAYFSLLVFGLLDNLRGPYFSSVLNEFQVSETEGAALFALTSAFSCLASWLGTSLLKKWGVRDLLAGSLVLMAAGFFLMTVGDRYGWVLLGACVFGFSLGGASFAQHMAVTEYAPAGRMAQLMAGLHAMYGLASMLAPGLAHVLLVAGWSWRWSFRAAALLPFFLAIYVWWSTREIVPLNKDGLRIRLQAATRRVRWHMLLAALMTSSYLLAEISLSTRLVRWLEVAYSVPAEDGSLTLTALFATLFAARLAAWRFAPESLQGLRRCLFMSAVLSLILSSFCFNGWTQGLPFVGLALGPFYPLAMAYLRGRFEQQAPLALGYALGLGSFTNVGMHFVIGVVADHWGLARAMWIGPVGLLITLSLLAGEARIKRGAQSQAHAID